MTAFPRVTNRDKGYDVVEVDEFFERARAAYSAPGDGSPRLTSAHIREVSFRLVRGGYSNRHVDDALERLETALAQHERNLAITEYGEQAWLKGAREIADEIALRLSRRPRHRFARCSSFDQGYRVRDVDRFATAVMEYVGAGKPMTVSQVRSVTFRAQRGGYREDQVDALIDALVKLMLAGGQQ
jgi:DivIVA domain-containing protein